MSVGGSVGMGWQYEDVRIGRSVRGGGGGSVGASPPIWTGRGSWCRHGRGGEGVCEGGRGIIWMENQNHYLMVHPKTHSIASASK